MTLTKDLMGIGVAAEEAIRVGDVGPQYLATLGGSAVSTATQIGGPNGATILELNPGSVAGSVNSVVFLATTELDRTYTLINSNSTNSANVFPATASAASFNGLGAGASFAIPANKVAYVARMGAVPPVSGSIASDRWIYTLSS
jgi:hypothetical protein